MLASNHGHPNALAHGKVQARLIVFFSNHEKRTGLFVIPELRHRVTRTRYRIPDIAVFEGEPAEEVPFNPPLIAIEILSPDDRVGYIIPKLEEYRHWRVANIWVIDPEDRKFFTYGADGLHESPVLALPEYSITITHADLFSQ